MSKLCSYGCGILIFSLLTAGFANACSIIETETCKQGIDTSQPIWQFANYDLLAPVEIPDMQAGQTEQSVSNQPASRLTGVLAILFVISVQVLLLKVRKILKKWAYVVNERVAEV